MKIIVLDYPNLKVEVVNAEIDSKEVENLLADLGFDLDNISYVCAPIDRLPITITNVEGASCEEAEVTRYLLSDNGEIERVK